jgi:hypothetical protein
VVGDDEEAAALVAVGDELEGAGGLHLAALDIAEVVEDQQPVFIELGQGVGELQDASGDCSAWTRIVAVVKRTRRP